MDNLFFISKRESSFINLSKLKRVGGEDLSQSEERQRGKLDDPQQYPRSGKQQQPRSHRSLQRHRNHQKSTVGRSFRDDLALGILTTISVK